MCNGCIFAYTDDLFMLSLCITTAHVCRKALFKTMVNYGLFYLIIALVSFGWAHEWECYWFGTSWSKDNYKPPKH